MNLIENLKTAQLNSGGVLVDLGSSSGDAYTLGGWKSGWRGRGTENGTTFQFAAANACRMWIPVRQGPGGTFTIRARAEGSLNGQVYINENHVGSFKLSRNEWRIVSFDFDFGLKPGLNEVLLRFDSLRRTGPDSRAAAKVDYIRLAEENEKVLNPAAAFDAPAYKIVKDGETVNGARLVPGERLCFTMPVPRGAVLSLEVRGENTDVGLAVSVKRDRPAGAHGEDDGAETVVKASEKAWSSGLVDLGVEEADVQFRQVELTAEGASAVLLAGARILVPREEADQKSGHTHGHVGNVIVILIDALRADRVKWLNPSSSQDPVFRENLKGNISVFESAWAAENWTKPSIASLLSGLYPSRHDTKTTQAVLPKGIEMVQEHLQRQGFNTAAFISNGYISDKFGFKRGWETYVNYVRERKRNQARYVYADARTWLAEQPGDRRFFLYIHTIDPHVPYIPPRSFIKRFDPEPYRGIVEPRKTAQLLAKIKTTGVNLTDRDTARIKALYDAEVAYHNEHLKKFLAFLYDRGFNRNTAVWITADHGEELFDHGSVGHGHSLYEEMLNVPLILATPGEKTDVIKRKDPVSLADLPATITSQLDVPPMQNTDGVDILASRKQTRSVFAEFLHGQKTVKLARFKLIMRGLNSTLYNLKDDPEESKDVSAQYPLAFQALRSRIGIYNGRFDNVVNTELPE